MEGSSKQSLVWDQTVSRTSLGETSYEEEQNNTQEYRTSSISRTTSSKRSFRRGFLNWVAYERNLSPNISDSVKRTCPLLNCEKCFGDEALLRQHLKGCVQLEKGFYRCHETDKIERIGKCETRCCQDLQQYKSLFSNAMHTLGRRLSPRGCRPSRFVNKISKKYSKSSHMFGVDPRIPDLESDWDMDGSDGPPEYEKYYTQWSPAELSSEREMLELPADSAYYEFAELCGEDAATPEYYDQTQSHIHELGVAEDDSTQVSQFLAHGTYQPAELSTPADAVSERKDSSLTQDLQDGWESTPMDYDITPEDLIDLYCFPEDATNLDTFTVDASSQQATQAFNATQSYDDDDVVSPVEGASWKDRQSDTYIVSPMGSFTDSDISQGDSVFSKSSCRSTTLSSLDSIENSIETPPETTSAPFISFLNEPERMCQDPIEELDIMDEPGTFQFHAEAKPIGNESPLFLSDGKAIAPKRILPWSYNSSLPTNGNLSPPATNFMDMSIEDCQTQHVVQIPTKNGRSLRQKVVKPPAQLRRRPVPLYSPSNDTFTPKLSPDIDYSENNAPPVKSFGLFQCEHCLAFLTDRSNLKRHMKSYCKKRPGYNPDKDKKPFKCEFENCNKGYSSRWNLAKHQKDKDHFPLVPIGSLQQFPSQIIHHSLDPHPSQNFPTVYSAPAAIQSWNYSQLNPCI